MYNIKIEELFEKLNLSEVIEEPTRIHGGLLHRMYRVKTTDFIYAVKALNPNILKRPGVVDNYKLSEQVSSYCENNGVAACVAKSFSGDQLIMHDGQYYLIYDWFEGASVFPEKLIPEQVMKVGRLMGQIHSMDFSEFDVSKKHHDSASGIKWETYLDHMHAKRRPWFGSIEYNRDFLSWLEKKVSNAVNMAEDKTVLSHRDLDPKNILWKDDNPCVIDWEAVGHVNPMIELVEMVYYWGSNPDYSMDFEKINSLLLGYKKHAKVDDSIHQLIYGAFGGKLGWLEYSLKRSLGIEKCDEEEQALGTKEAVETLDMILKQVKVIPQILECLKE